MLEPDRLADRDGGLGPSDASSNLPRATFVVRIVRESDFTDVAAKG